MTPHLRTTLAALISMSLAACAAGPARGRDATPAPSAARRSLVHERTSGNDTLTLAMCLTRHALSAPAARRLARLQHEPAAMQLATISAWVETQSPRHRHFAPLRNLEHDETPRNVESLGAIVYARARELALAALPRDASDHDRALAQGMVADGFASYLAGRFLLAVETSTGTTVALAPTSQRLSAGATEELHDALAFICTAHRVFARPPSTTAQVLDPRRWRNNEPAVTVSIASQRASRWRADSTQTFGALDLRRLLHHGFDAVAADRLARAWAGGVLVRWRHGAVLARTIALVARSGAALSLCSTMRSWASRDAFRSSHTVVRCDGTAVRVGIAPNRASARELAAV